MPQTVLELIKHRGRALDGSSQEKGVEFDPLTPMPAAPGFANAIVELNDPRPGTTRYPISLESFDSLKAAAPKIKIRAKKSSVIFADALEDKLEVVSASQGTAAAPMAFAPAAPPAPSYPTPSTHFKGIAATGWFPPDCTMAVGLSHVLLSVNSSVAFYDKMGTVALPQQTLTVWFANVVQDATIFDPKALYDQHDNRWILVAAAINPAQKRSWFLLSISKTADPAAGWYNYALDATLDGDTQTTNWIDYPCLGVDSQAVYLTGNMFRFNGGFSYSKIRVIPKAGPYAGGSVPYKDLVKLKNTDGSFAFTVQPCHTFGAPQIQYFINSYFPDAQSPMKDQISLWDLSNPLTTPTLTVRTIPTSPYSLPPDAEQSGGTDRIATGDVRMLNAVFRGGSVWCALTTLQNWGDGANVAAAHWFQVEAATGSLLQQGIYGANGSYYSFPAVMPDDNGNMVMTFSRCGATEFGSIYFTGRRATDALGTLQSSTLLIAGTSYYVKKDRNGINRWGDYAGIASDPMNSGLIWFYALYADTGNNWATHVGSAF